MFRHFVAPARSPEILHMWITQEDFSCPLVILINTLFSNWTSIFEWKVLCMFHIALQVHLHLWDGEIKGCGYRIRGRTIWPPCPALSQTPPDVMRLCEKATLQLLRRWKWAQEPLLGRMLYRRFMVWLPGVNSSLILLHSCKPQDGEKQRATNLPGFLCSFPHCR